MSQEISGRRPRLRVDPAASTISGCPAALRTPTSLPEAASVGLAKGYSNFCVWDQDIINALDVDVYPARAPGGARIARLPCRWNMIPSTGPARAPHGPRRAERGRRPAVSAFWFPMVWFPSPRQRRSVLLYGPTRLS